MKLQQEVILGEIKGYKYSGDVCSGFQSQGGSLHLHASSHSGGVCPGVQSQRGCFVICVWWTPGFTSKCNTYQPLVDQHGSLTPHPQTTVRVVLMHNVYRWLKLQPAGLSRLSWKVNKQIYQKTDGLSLLHFSSFQIFWLLLFGATNVASNNWMLLIAKLW